MLDLGLSKIVVIAAVALIVLGPERLPRMARIAGTLFGRAQRYVRDVKDEVAREMDFSELKDLGQTVQAQVDEVRQSWQDVPVPHFNPAHRVGRKHWRVQTSRAPQWFKHQNGVKSRLSSDAARMTHRRISSQRHSFFN